MSFSVHVYQNEYLPLGATEVNAIIRVESRGGRPAVTGTEKAVVFVVDNSGSMENPSSKIRSARRAAAEAIRLLPDGTLFALVAGNHEARSVYPQTNELARADGRTRAEAVSVTGEVWAGGGTAMSTWLDHVRTLLEPHPEAIRLAYLLTDGQNEGEPASALDAAIARAQGVFQCDTRGVGAEYDVDELRRISASLQGEEDIIKHPEAMEEDFRAFMARAIGRNIADVRLRIRTPGSSVRFLRQVHPLIEDLTGRGEPSVVDAMVADYPTGAWAGDESRDYHLCVDVQPGEGEKLAARVMLVAGGQEVARDGIGDGIGEGSGDAGQPIGGLVRAVWTDDPRRFTRPNREVAGYTGQAEIAQATDEGLEAWERGDLDTATVRLGQAVQRAASTGNTALLERLSSLVDVVDETRGTVRLRKDVADIDVKEQRTRSRRTVRVDAGHQAATT